VTTAIEIRPAKADDCSALLDMIHQHAQYELGKASVSDATLLELIACSAPPVSIFVAVSKAQLLGYAALTFDFSLWRGSRWAHLDCLYVKTEARSLGIGAQLLAYAIGAARNSGADRIEWQTPDWNKRAISFYEREGAEAHVKVRLAVEL
jgi:GNAT superfamily N-acetyltransferase